MIYEHVTAVTNEEIRSFDVDEAITFVDNRTVVCGGNMYPIIKVVDIGYSSTDRDTKVARYFQFPSNLQQKQLP